MHQHHLNISTSQHLNTITNHHHPENLVSIPRQPPANHTAHPQPHPSSHHGSSIHRHCNPTLPLQQKPLLTPSAPPPQTKLKVALKLSVSRLRMVQQRETALAKVNRRQMAQLLEQGKEESAKIRVENIIRQDISVELMEILELYCELLLARVQLMEAKYAPLPLNGDQD